MQKLARLSDLARGMQDDHCKKFPVQVATAGLDAGRSATLPFSQRMSLPLSHFLPTKPTHLAQGNHRILIRQNRYGAPREIG
jgi:hypothetical protein